jgi:hypothetical protein
MDQTSTGGPGGRLGSMTEAEFGSEFSGQGGSDQENEEEEELYQRTSDYQTTAAKRR